MDTILGIDFGTSKIAFVLVDPHEKKLLRCCSFHTNADLRLADPALKEQDVVQIQKVFYQGMEELLGDGEARVLSVGITGQMHGVLGVDREGRAVTNLVTWQDGRGHCHVGDGKTLIEDMHERAGRRPVASGYGIVTLYDWVRSGKHGDLAVICTLPDYFAMLLTGSIAPVIDYTMADSTGAFDSGALCWDLHYLSGLGINENLFPKTVPPTTPAGFVEDPLVKSILGQKRVPVAVPIGDNQASYLGSVREHFSSLLVNIGTGSQISLAVRSPVDTGLQGVIDGYDVVLRPFVGNAWLVAGNALSGGVVYAALYNFFKKTGEELFGMSDFHNLWEQMEELARRAPDSAGLVVYPLFSGKRSDPKACGRIEGISMENFTPAGLIHGTLEGIVAILKDMMDPRVIEERKYIIGSGNGFRRNPTLREIASELFKRQILVPAHEEEAAVGAAINGAVSSGVFRNFSEAVEVIRYR